MSGLGLSAWPAGRLGEALGELARRGGLSRSAEAVPEPAEAGGDALDRWVEGAAARLGFEAEPVALPHPEVARFLSGAGPVLARVAGAAGPRFLAVLPARRGRLRLVGPDLAERGAAAADVRSVLFSGLEAPALEEIDRCLGGAGIPDRRAERARAALLGERLRFERTEGLWLLRLPPHAGFLGRLRRAGLLRRLGLLLAAHTAAYGFWLLSWWAIGRAALLERVDAGWLLAWGLLLLTMVPLRLLALWSQGVLALGAGGLLKQRLLHGVLRSDPETIRREGAGQLLGRTLESEAVESLALGGGVLALLAAIELLLSGAVLSRGAGGGLSVTLLVLWVVVSLWSAARIHRRRDRWTAERRSLTNDLVEKLVGHRTRRAQESPERRHRGEDESLQSYLLASRSMDRAATILLALAPRGWLVLGLLALGPAFVTGQGTPESLALSLGGLLLAFRALQKLAFGTAHLVAARVAWKQVAPILRAAARAEPAGGAAEALASRGTPPGQPVLEARDVHFAHAGRPDPVLHGLSLEIRSGERLLLEGPSGGGKSTLASLLSGLREPRSGHLVLHGLDARTWGPAAWRRRVAAAPQFHENHVLTETLAFNLLLGRRWPPREEDFAEAERLCRELGLGGLLDRMPAGLQQMLGEGGWQLSHGERSRLFMARALLQGSDLVLLDESFAALDPESLDRCLRCVLARAPTLLVIAHP